jgi:hypothetical protein
LNSFFYLESCFYEVAYEIQNTPTLKLLESPLCIPLEIPVIGLYFLFHNEVSLETCCRQTASSFQDQTTLVSTSLKVLLRAYIYNPTSSTTCTPPFHTRVHFTSFYAQQKRKVIPLIFTKAYRRSRGIAPLIFKLDIRLSSVAAGLPNRTLYHIGSYILKLCRSNTVLHK